MLRWKSSLKPAAAAPATDYRSTIIADNPVAYYRLGEASGFTASDEIGSSDGTYGGDVTLGVTGALSGDSNTSISLAGSSTQYDGVTVSSLATASYSSGITIEFWANWDSTNYSGFGIEAYKDSNNRIFLDARGSSPHWDFRIAGTWYSAVGAGFQDGWHLYAFTHDGTNAKTYRDGVLQNTQSASATTFDPTSMGIGQGSAGYNVFTGGVDEAAIYNSALSATELLAHYTAGTGSGGAITLEDSAVTTAQSFASPLNIDVNIPAVSTNDILLLLVTTNDPSEPTASPPTNWTKIAEKDGSSSSASTVAAYWKRASGSALATTETWSSFFPNGESYYIWVGAYSGCTTSGSPIDAYGTAAISYSSTWSVNITTTVNNTMIVTISGTTNSGVTQTWSDGTELIDTQYPGSDAAVSINEKLESSSGAKTRTATASTPTSDTLIAVALKPAAAAADYRSTILADNPLFYYRLGEASSDTSGNVYDEVAASNNGTYYNQPDLGETGAISGDSNTAVKFKEASSEYAETVTLTSETSVRPCTIECFVRLDGASDNFAGIVFTRGTVNACGLNYRNTFGKIGYTWNNTPNTYNWNNGPTLDDDTWYYLALVVEYNKATVYTIEEDGTVTSYVNSVTHNAMNFSTDPWYIGRDPTSIRYFQGTIDEVAIYDQALSQSTLEAHAAAAGFSS